MANPAIRIEPFLLDSPLGPLCVYTAPADQPPQGAVLYLHPFAEEMHKSRRMAALQARLCDTRSRHPADRPDRLRRQLRRRSR